MTTQLRVGFVGAGEQTWESLVPAFQKLGARREGIELVGVADLDRDRARWVAEDRGIPRAFGSQEEMLSSAGVNAVVIAVPHRFHASEALKALQAGCDVFLEKPMAETVAQARRLLDVAREQDLVLMVDYQYNRQLREVLAALHDGLIGDRFMVRGAFALTDGFPNRPGFHDSPEAGGVRLDYLSHLVSVTLAAVGERQTPVAVTAQGWGHAGKRAFGSGFRTQHRVDATVRFTRNVRAELIVDWAAHVRRLSLEVDGQEGMVRIPMMGAELNPEAFVPTVYRRPPGSPVTSQRLAAFAPTPTEESFVLQAQAFDDAIRHDQPLRFPFAPEFALRVQGVLDAAGRSIERGGAEVMVGRA